LQDRSTAQVENAQLKGVVRSLQTGVSSAKKPSQRPKSAGYLHRCLRFFSTNVIVIPLVHENFIEKEVNNHFENMAMRLERTLETTLAG
jgi:hypothetical protein